MSNFNMPPGVSTADIPGNRRELRADMLRAARQAVEENARMNQVSLFGLLAYWFPDATDEQIDAVVEYVL